MQTRREFLARLAAGTACSAAAHPVLTRAAFAAAPGENRLVVIILRGAMDGLDVIRPLADPLLAAYRPGLLAADAEATGLDGSFALHPGLSALLPLWRAGEFGAVHAVSTPYRDKRSHFDGQDLLEAGTGGVGEARDGWLNRMLQVMGPVPVTTAFSIGTGELLVLRGAAPASSWSPAAELTLSPQGRRLLEAIYHDDPLFAEAARMAIDLGAEPGMAAAEGPARQGLRAQALADFAVDRLRVETRIAAFSISGWDTHRRQAQAIGAPLAALAETITTLRDGLGPLWARTGVIALTEFGRTVRENGSGGTDHGTGAAMLYAGGALAGGQVTGRWPGLAEADLYDGRDLRPTADVRAMAGWVMRGLFGLDRAALEGTVFPGLDLGADPRLVL